MDGSRYVQVQGLSHRYGSVVALENVSFELAKGKVLGLLGASGSGKSTLLAAVAGMIVPTRGKVVVAGENLLHRPTHKRALGMVFQDYALWPHMTVGENVAFALRRQERSRQAREARVREALARVGLEGLADRRPGQLSGGQQQRVALARAIVAQPNLLLLDEPLSALDPATRGAVRQELASLLQRLGLTTLLVTHDREEAFALSDLVAVLHEGKLLQIGTPHDVYERPQSAEVARLMGHNLLRGRCQDEFTVVLEGGLQLTCAQRLPPGEVVLAIAPERVTVASSLHQPNVVPAQLLSCTYCGGGYRLQLGLGAGSAQTVCGLATRAPANPRLYLHLPPTSLQVVASAAAPSAVHIPSPLEVT